MLGIAALTPTYAAHGLRGEQAEELRVRLHPTPSNHRSP
jgi:hypothetical protein